MNSQFSLALELSNVFPVRAVVETAATQFLKLVRDLRRSGSDIIIEEDLATIFGRGRINTELEDRFKDAVKLQTFVPLYQECEIRLDSGPGPTMHRALKERRYLTTMVQLSLLAWMQDRQDLGTMLAWCMTERQRGGVQDASDCGFEGIVSTLATCSSQSSNFAWSYYVEQVEAKFQRYIRSYNFHTDYTRMSHNLLLGAMDYLYLVQSLPDHRKILLSNQKGCIILIIWAHYVLDLTVTIANTRDPDENIVFGNRQEPQVIITWQYQCKDHTNDFSWVSHCTQRQPEIRLLDQDMSVILQSSPKEHRTLDAIARDRHPLLGYGRVFLYRTFNHGLITNDNDPVYEESVKLITALAIHVSGRLDRQVDSHMRNEEQLETLPRSKIPIEVWRVLASARVIFAGIEPQPAGTDAYVEFLADSGLNDDNLPKSLYSFLKKAKDRDEQFPRPKNLLDNIQDLARVVLLFAHVVDVESCAEMPILLCNGFREMDLQVKKLCRNPNTRATVSCETVFYGILRLLSADALNRPYGPQSTISSNEDSQFLFLCSDFGWSVFLDTVGDKDPADVKPHLIHIQKGVPTNSKTQERKSQISDGPWVQADLPRVYRIPPAETKTSLPRLAAKVTHRKEYWTSRAHQFEMNLAYLVEPTPNSLLRQFDVQLSPVEDWTTYRGMHFQIWETFSTPPCEHEPEITPKVPLQLGPDAIAILGWSNAAEETSSGPYPQRIVIFLTRGDARIRWLAIRNATVGDGAPEYCDQRETMLRTLDCCDACALEHVASMPGRWTLIL